MNNFKKNYNPKYTNMQYITMQLCLIHLYLELKQQNCQPTPIVHLSESI